MSKLWLADSVKLLMPWLAMHPDASERWYVCPRCFWVGASLSHITELVTCQRPDSDTVAWLSVLGQDGTGRCGVPQVWLDEIAPKVADALASTFRIGGTNAVIRLLNGLEPIMLGLDVPTTSPHYFDFAELRPGSIVGNPHQAGWFATKNEPRKK